ncbi:MAG TPA: heparan-alpha-glucosaminide N-acetyltransferase domain-containing protein [Bacteroidota bacterium]|nr:heparan-alpha-glucosaminide N-acetyltransferase domain-containing protein [Bacteroidota bacterium]
MPPSKRLSFIDLLRGWAVIVMIETHVVNATIRPEIAAQPWFNIINFINGLVAPTFLFASGMAYAVTTRRKLDSYLSLGTPLFRQLWRLVFILLLGYGLHIPKFNLGQMLEGVSERQWLLFYQSDVLHCIAVSLLMLQIMLLSVRTERRLYRIAAGLAVVLLFATPPMWSVDWLQVVPAPLAAYLNGLHHSLFPLFPWSVFLLAGAIAGHLFGESQKQAPAGGEGMRAFPHGAFARAGGALIGVSVLLLPLGFVYPSYDYWRYSPSYVLLRLGIVVLLCASMMLFEQRRSVSPKSLVTLVGRESLLVYATHLLLIYGNFGTFSFQQWSDHTFGLPEAFGWTVVLLGLMILLASAWDWVRHQDPRWKRWIQWGVLAITLGVFVWGPGQ